MSQFVLTTLLERNPYHRNFGYHTHVPHGTQFGVNGLLTHLQDV